MSLTQRRSSYVLLPAAILLHLLSLMFAGNNGLAMFIAGAVMLIISIILNLRSGTGKREEFYWVPAIGCIFLSVFTLFMYVIGFTLLSVFGSWMD